MSETSHTFEPLKTCMIAKSVDGNYGSGIAVRAIMTADNIVVAELTQNAMPECADLFAAAPDMLAAMQKVFEELFRCQHESIQVSGRTRDEFIKIMRPAINKAEGRT